MGVVEDANGDETLTWRWIGRNRWFLVMVALVVAGGVEMRSAVAAVGREQITIAVVQVELTRTLNDHEKRLIAAETLSNEVSRRLRDLEEGQRALLVSAADNQALLRQLVSQTTPAGPARR